MQQQINGYLSELKCNKIKCCYIYFLNNFYLVQKIVDMCINLVTNQR